MALLPYSPAGGAGGKSLTPEQEETLKYLHYSPAKNKIIADRTIATEPSSIDVGNHTLSSGGQNFLFTNRTGGVVYSPPWAGVKPQQLVENAGAHGIIPPSIRTYSEMLGVGELFGDPVPMTAVDFKFDMAFPLDIAVWGCELVLAEPIEPDDWLFLYIRAGTEIDAVTYEQIRTGFRHASGDQLRWDFDHQAEWSKHSSIHAKIMISKGSQDSPKTPLRVRKGTSGIDNPAVAIHYRSFENQDLAAGVFPFMQSMNVRYSGTYVAVDLMVPFTKLTVLTDLGFKSFTVVDGGANFSAGALTVDFGMYGIATLQNIGDMVLFYFYEDNWRYRNLRTWDSGLVDGMATTQPNAVEPYMAVISRFDGSITSAPHTTSEQIYYLSDTTGPIQKQLNAKASFLLSGTQRSVNTSFTTPQSARDTGFCVLKIRWDVFGVSSHILPLSDDSYIFMAPPTNSFATGNNVFMCQVTVSAGVISFAKLGFKDSTTGAYSDRLTSAYYKYSIHAING